MSIGRVERASIGAQSRSRRWRARATAVVGAGVVLCAAAGESAADVVIQRRFEATKDNAWALLDLGSTQANQAASDPKRIAVGPAGEVYVLTKRPLEGPPSAVAVLRVDRGMLEPVGGDIQGDAEGLYADPSGLYLGTKGTPAKRKGEVWKLDGGTWRPISGAGISAEIHAIFRLGDVLYVGTNNDGLYKVDGESLVRVGARKVIEEGGFAWTRLGDWGADTERLAATPEGDILAVGKDLRVRRFSKGAWTDLGNVAEVVLDATGAVTSFVREPKAVAVSGDRVYVGTKGGPMAPEGRETGAVFMWNGTAWSRLGDSAGLKKEVKVVIPLAGGEVLAGTTETGVWHWNGTAWTERSMGLPNDAGKIKAEVLEAAPGGKLWVATKNTLFESANGGATWSEVGFLAAGEEIRSVAASPAGAVHVGAKRGDGTGAVFVFEGKTAKQVGGDLTKEVRGLAFAADGTAFAALGGNSGLFRLEAGMWKPAVGNLAGDAADFKQIVITGGRFFGATKAGIQEGMVKDRVETFKSSLILREVRSLWARDGMLFAGVKVGGVFRMGAGDGDDGLAFQRIDEGLPDVETEGLAIQPSEAIALGKRLLYSAAIAGAADPLKFTPLGTNPGAAKLDGDGKMVFTGETELKDAVRVGAKLFVGAKDGLFVSGDQGATWSLFGGPAEVKAVAVVGSKLYAAWKGAIVPDPANAPAVSVGVAGIAIRDLAAAPAPDTTAPGAMSGVTAPPPGAQKIDKGGCQMGGSAPGAVGPLWCLALAAWAVLRPRGRSVRGARRRGVAPRTGARATSKGDPS